MSLPHVFFRILVNVRGGVASFLDSVFPRVCHSDSFAFTSSTQREGGVALLYLAS